MKNIFVTPLGAVLFLLTLTRCSPPTNLSLETYNDRFFKNIQGSYTQIRPFINKLIAVKNPKNKIFKVSKQGNIIYCGQEFAVLERILSSTEALYRITNGIYYIKVNPSYSLSAKALNDPHYQIIAVRNF